MVAGRRSWALAGRSGTADGRSSKFGAPAASRPVPCGRAVNDEIALGRKVVNDRSVLDEVPVCSVGQGREADELKRAVGHDECGSHAGEISLQRFPDEVSQRCGGSTVGGLGKAPGAPEAPGNCGRPGEGASSESHLGVDRRSRGREERARVPSSRAAGRMPRTSRREERASSGGSRQGPSRTARSGRRRRAPRRREGRGRPPRARPRPASGSGGSPRSSRRAPARQRPSPRVPPRGASGTSRGSSRPRPSPSGSRGVPAPRRSRRGDGRRPGRAPPESPGGARPSRPGRGRGSESERPERPSPRPARGVSRLPRSRGPVRTASSPRGSVHFARRATRSWTGGGVGRSTRP